MVMQTRKVVTNLGSSLLKDRFQRQHNYLRISITDKCNLRCRYCMPAEGIEATAKDKLMTIDEIFRVARVLVERCGVNKIRLTGGEPMIDHKIIPLISKLKSLKVSGLKNIGMTTNGINLKNKCALLHDIGLDNINISLDTLQPLKFERMTRRKGWNSVINGIKEALNTPFETVKLNCVILKGENDDEVIDFVNLAEKNELHVRFIEYMPFDSNSWSKEKMISSSALVDRIRQIYPNFESLTPIDPHDTSRNYRCPNFSGTVGFISSMSDNFCSSCNRLRITADGSLKVCLFGVEELSIRDLIRNGANDNEIIGSIASSLIKKHKHHAGGLALSTMQNRPMVKIGASRMFHTTARLATSDGFSHLDPDGNIHMVDISRKEKTNREASATGKIFVGRKVLDLLKQGKIIKGDLLATAKLAGIIAAKQTSQIIPLCHQINLTWVNLVTDVNFEEGTITVKSTVRTSFSTGVEMECLVAASVALLTIYDMCKSVNKHMTITDIRLLSKSKVNDLCQ